MADIPVPIEIATQIVPLILERVKETLQYNLIDILPEGHPARGTLVKIGRFQENPVEKNISLAISPGDFEDPAFMDGRIDNPEFRDLRIRYVPVSEIGGGEMWWRRGTCNLQVFFVRQRYSEEDAMRTAYDFYGRVLNALRGVSFSKVKDSFGEMAVPPLYVESSAFFESGGASQYIWRGKIRWRMLTWKD